MTDRVQPALALFGSSLGRRILMVLAVVLTACSLLFLTLFVVALRNRLIEGHARMATQQSSVLEFALRSAVMRNDGGAISDAITRLSREDGVTAISLITTNGDIRASSDASIQGKTFAVVSGHVLPVPWPERPQFTTTAAGKNVIRSFTPVGGATALADNGVLVVDLDAGDVVRDYWRAGLLLAAAGFAVLLAALYAIMMAVKHHVLQPVANIAEAASRFSDGNLEARTLVHGSGELADLGQRFNAMAAHVGANVRAVQANERFVQDVLDAAPDGMRVIGPDYRILKVNAAYCSQLGVTPDQVLGLPCHLSSHRLKAPCSPTLVPCPMVELSDRGKTSVKCRHRHERADGSEVFVEVSAARVLLEQDGKSLPCIVESIRDLSNQAEASHGQRLAEIGQLATGIAHEIHNPLWSIHLAMEAMRNDMAARGEDVSGESYIATADREIQRCLDVTSRLLRVSEPSSQEKMLLDLAPLLKDVMSLLTYQAAQAGVATTLDIKGNPRAIANESDLGIVFVNLAQNAIHAMPRGGTLTVVAGARNGRVGVSFTDTGVGISAEDRARIFWPFWSKRADGSTGTGLGLAICHSTVERLNGELTLTSTVGEGSTFRVTLPDPDHSGDPQS